MYHSHSLQNSRLRVGVGVLLYAGSACLAAPTLAQNASDQDTRLRLDQQIDGQKRKTEKELLENADALDRPPHSLEIDGKTYSG